MNLSKTFTEKIRSILEQPRLNVSSVSLLMTLSRQLIEENDLQREYRYLKLYCDWTLHTKIDRSAIAKQILDLISAEIRSNDSKQYNDVILKIIGLENLRSDFINLYTTFNIPTNIFEIKSIWVGFIGVLSRLIINKPLIRNTGQIDNNQTQAIALRLVDKNDSVAAKIPLEIDEAIFWIVEINKPGIYICGLFGLSQPNSDFKRLE